MKYSIYIPEEDEAIDYISFVLTGGYGAVNGILKINEDVVDSLGMVKKGTELKIPQKRQSEGKKLRKLWE